MSNTLKLPIESLKLHVDISGFDLSTLPPRKTSILGQPRAQAAFEFGIAMSNPGYNIFVMGDPGLGRLTMVTDHINAIAHHLPAPSTYAYVDNFANPREPLVIELPAEQGQMLSKDIETLIDDVLIAFPAAFESPSYQQKKNAIERQFTQLYNAAIDQVEEKAQTLQTALFREGESITFAPIVDEKPLSPEQFAQLPQPERELFHSHVEELEDYLSEVLLELPGWRRSMVDKLRQLDNDTINQILEPLLTSLYDKYEAIDDVITYLAELKSHLETTIGDTAQFGRALEMGDYSTRRTALVEQYVPNILVENRQDGGVPVVHESHPIYQNLFGRIEYMNDQGTLITNYRKICAGALHKANGGYLILDAEKLLTYPFVWDSLKRALQSCCIEIDTPYSEFGINTITLKPEVIPLKVKIVLVGSPDIYYLLEEMDSEFNEMFKVLADFDNHIPRNDDSVRHFAELMVQHAQDAQIRPLTRRAIEALIEHSCRLAEDQHHFSARIRDSLEIIDEANLFANKGHADEIDHSHIGQALAAREYRNGRLPQSILEEMLDGTILIDTEGEAVGKINGLTVMEIGGSYFGAPARITTTVYPGSRGIVDIEREAELGQAIHSKGVMIITGYLGHCYAQQFPLAISASIAVEQSYGYIDGDSASLAELCCLISALTRTPIKQGFAVTGSVNQYGEVQAIGGVNEKIEGFFRLCQSRGLNGHHAVIIPAANKRNLMLKQEVVDAVAQGLFAVYAVTSVDETLELLTGHLAGKVAADGQYPENSINFKAIARLKEISELAIDDDKEESA